MKKIISHIRWFFAIVPFGIVSIITAPVIYPLAQLIEFALPRCNPLWWWLDDEIENNESNKDWKLMYQDKPKWLKYYIWHAIRNRMWNLKSSIKPEKARENGIYNHEIIVEMLVDDLCRNGIKLVQSGIYMEMPGYKWVDKLGNEGWQVFRGEYISKTYSNVGEIKYWYTANDKLYFRWAIAKEIQILNKIFYFQFSMGANEKWYLFNLKLTAK